MRGKKPGRVRGVMFFLAMAVFFVLASVGDTRADISSVEAEIAAINNQITTITNEQLAPLEAEIADLRASMDEARTFMNKFAERNDWLLKEYAAHKHRLRLYQGQELQLSMSYIDFFNAKNTWQNSTDPEVRRAQIIVMFRYLCGNTSEPSQLELDPNKQKDFVDQASLIVTKKAVARIGQALVLLGDLTTELIDAITGIPANLKEVAFNIIEFAAKSTARLLPDDTVKALNETCLQYIPYMEFQKARAEALANDLNAIRNREEFGGEEGREEALAKTRALIAYEQDVMDQLEPEVNTYRTKKAEVEAGFAAMQADLAAKTAQRDALRKTLLQYTQNKIDKEFELKQLQEQQAVAENGGPTNYVTGLSAASSASILAADALTSALLNLPRYAVLSANAAYVTQKSDQCSYQEKVGENQYVTKYESYYTRLTFNSPVAQPIWRKVNPTGDVNIVGNQAYGVAVGVVPIQTGLSPAFTGESWGDPQHCSQTYLPQGGGEKASNLLNIQVKKVAAALFLPDTYYNRESKGGLTGTALFDAIAAAAESWGKGIDLFVGGNVQQYNSLAVHYTVLNADGTRAYFTMGAPQMRPEGDRQAFEIDNRMKVLAPGRVNLFPLITDKDGILVSDGVVNPLVVTGNKVEPTADANEVTGLTPADDILLPVKEAGTFKVNVQGDAEMTRYEVRWRYKIYKTSGYPTGWVDFTRHNGAAVTPFTGAPGLWVSANPVTLTDPADYNQKFRVEFDIVRKYDGVVVYTGKFENIRSIVKGRGFFLADKPTGAIYPGSDYYLFRGLQTLAPAIVSKQLELRLDLGDGQSVAVPFTDTVKGLLYGTDAAKNQNLGTINVYESYLYMSLSTTDACGSVDLGLYKLQDADGESLLNNMGIVVARNENTLMTGIDVNLFRVNYRETDAGPFYVLKGCTASPMQDFKTRWTFFDETTAEAPFTSAGLLKESLTPMTKGLKRVEILNGQGNTAAQVGFLSASGGSTVNRVPAEVGMYYSVTSEYAYDETKQGYGGQLRQVAKNDLGREFHQFELDFRFPAGFPSVWVRTVNDINGASLPYVENVAISPSGLAFDALMPGAGNYTALAVLQPPAFGSLKIEGSRVLYTPNAGFNKLDRFLIRIDGRVCDIVPEVVFHNLQVEADFSGPRPVIRFKLVFTPVYQYGNYALGLAFSDGSRNPLAVAVGQAPAKLAVTATADGVNINKGTILGNERDQFSLSLTPAGGAPGEVPVDVWYHTAPPGFFAYKNQDRPLDKMFVLHRFFEFFENGALLLKNLFASNGTVLVNGQPVNYVDIIDVAAIETFTFRPRADFTGPASIYVNGSADGGATWTNQMRIGGRILAASAAPGLAEVIAILQLTAGLPVLPPDAAFVPDINGDGRIGLAEAIHIIHKAAGLR